MPRQSKGARLQLRKANGTRQAVWIIRDGRHRESTGCAPGELDAAERKLREYLATKYQAPRIKQRDPSEVRVADVLNIYADDVADNDSRPKEIAARVAHLGAFFGAKTLADINKKLCKQYAQERGYQAAARCELEDLRAAIGYHFEEARKGFAPSRCRYGCRRVARHANRG